MEGVGKLLPEAGLQQLQQILVLHVEPDRLIFQPAAGKGTGTANLKAHIIQVFIDLVHVELLVVKSAFPDSCGHGGLGFHRQGELEPAYRTLQEEGQCFRHQPARHGAFCGLSDILSTEGEIGGADAAAKGNSTGDAVQHGLLQHPKHSGHVSSLQLGLLAADAVSRTAAVILPAEAGLVPTGKEVFLGSKDTGNLLQQLSHLGIHGDVTLLLLQGFNGEAEDPGQLAALRHGGAEQAGQAVEGVIPAGLAAFHLDAHTGCIQCGSLDGAEQNQLLHQGASGFAALGGLHPFVGGARFTLLIQGVILPEASRRHLVTFGTGIDEYPGLKPAVVCLAQQQFLLLLRPDAEVALNQIQIVGPVVAPAAFAKGGVGLTVGSTDAAGGKGIHGLVVQAPVLSSHCQLTRGKGLGKQGDGLLLYPSRQVSNQGSGLLSREGKAAGVNHQRIVAVALNQLKEGADVVVAQLGMIQDIAATVLVDVTEVAVALCIIFFPHREIVILPFGIAVLAGIQVEGCSLLSIPEEVRHTAAKQVVNIGLTAVSVKYRIGGVGIGSCGQVIGELLCFFPLFLKPGRTSDLLGKGMEPLLAFSLTIEGVNHQLLTGCQTGSPGQEAAGEEVLSHLMDGAESFQSLFGELTSHSKAGILTKDDAGLHQRTEKSTFLIHTQAEVDALNAGYHCGIGHGSTNPEAGHPGLHILSLHPGLGQLSHLLQRIIAHAIGNNGRHTIQQFQFHHAVGDVLHSQAPHQGSGPLSGQAEVEGGGSEIAGAGKDFHLTSANVHIAGSGKQLLILAIHPAEGPEAGAGIVLVGGMGCAELHDGMVLVHGAKAANALTSVVVIHPCRNALGAGNTRQEAGKGRFLLIIFHYKAIVVVKHAADLLYLFLAAQFDGHGATVLGAEMLPAQQNLGAFEIAGAAVDLHRLDLIFSIIQSQGIVEADG